MDSYHFEDRLLIRRDRHRVNIRRQTKEGMLEKRRTEIIAVMEAPLRQAKDKHQWEKAIALAESQLETNAVQSLTLLTDMVVDLIGRVVQGSCVPVEFGPKICYIGLRKLNLAEGAKLTGVMAAQAPYAVQLINQDIVERCLSLIQSNTDIEMLRLLTWVLCELSSVEEILKDPKMMQLRNHYRLLLEKSRNSRHYNQLLRNLTNNKDYLPQEEIVMRELFATFASGKVAKMHFAALAIGNCIRFGRSSNFLSCINEYVEFSWVLAMKPCNSRTSRAGKQYLLVLAERASPESTDCMMELGILRSLASRFQLEYLQEKIQTLRLLRVILASVNIENFEDVARSDEITQIFQTIFTNENIELVEAGMLCFRELLRAGRQLSDNFQQLISRFQTHDLERLAHDANSDIAQLTCSILDEYFNDDRMY